MILISLLLANHFSEGNRYVVCGTLTVRKVDRDMGGSGTSII